MLQSLLLHGYLLVALAATCSLIGACAFAFVWHARATREMNDHIRTLEKERDNLALWIEDAKQREYIDQKTGIPNEKKMEEDIFLFCRDIEAAKIDKFCITQVDLENFDQINVVTSSRKGDIAIRAFAQTVYRSMRRDEHMFRLDPDERSSVGGNGIFRRQVGGDEFIFLTRGPASVALGFVHRLLLNVMPQYSRELSGQLPLVDPMTLSLRAGVVEIGRKEVLEITTLEQARRYIDVAERRCYKAKNKEHNLRVFWPSVVEQTHSSEVSKNAAELTLIDILSQLRRVEWERADLERKHHAPGKEPGAPEGQPPEMGALLERISRLKMDARFLLAFT